MNKKSEFKGHSALFLSKKFGNHDFRYIFFVEREGILGLAEASFVEMGSVTMNPREKTFYRIAKREIQRILLSGSALTIKDRRYSPEEVALAKSCEQGAITNEEFVKQRIAYGNKIRKTLYRR